MGAARLLAKGWIVFCLYVGALALGGGQHGVALTGAGGTMLVCLLLFGAMGILFIAGYGLSSAHFHPPLLSRLKASNLLPGFTELVFIAFAFVLLPVQLYPTNPRPPPQLYSDQSSIKARRRSHPQWITPPHPIHHPPLRSRMMCWIHSAN